ncbi:hypothetical protein TGAM01_v201299 [Trichoderma gamsii]|uniref:Uncharacterized protein n=1 Tax=Trichoderma gamsii TaxID=398673 RepID=A0A2P5A091_9HYPO|nr:hypothetical protein TGAM01_v201299 [Trichoderma gamsii]PON29933.1 hypothetical protein TGAM01_v201299 [Trichoderma gamsii]
MAACGLDCMKGKYTYAGALFGLLVPCRCISDTRRSRKRACDKIIRSIVGTSRRYDRPTTSRSMLK